MGKGTRNGRKNEPGVRAERLREQSGCGNPAAESTSGLVAYFNGEPAGWCAVEPRTAYQRLLRARVPWSGRQEDKDDDGVWAATCFVTRTGFRRRGISRALAHATVDFARSRGARAVEGYTIINRPGQEFSSGELYVGSRSIFCRCRLHRAEQADAEACRRADRFLAPAGAGRRPVLPDRPPSPAGAPAAPDGR
jgi:GNAT superfamily N-acetyltransferase